MYWVAVSFTDSEYLTKKSNFSFNLKIKSTGDLSDFSFSLFNDERRLIQFLKIVRASKVKTRDGDNYYCNNDDYDDDNYEN